MYSLPQLYGEKPFADSYLPGCMYTQRPYYETDSAAAGTSTSSSASSGASGTLTASMASILPLPLLPTDIDLNDANIKHTLEDVLSRQMLLLCRLNQLEQQLLSQVPASTTATTTSTSSVDPSPKLTISGVEDVAVHFNLDSVPYSLFALLQVLRKSTPVMANLHVHSSVAGQPAVVTRVAALRAELARTIGFHFTTSEQYLTRAQFPLIVTFIVTSTTTTPRVTFRAGQTLVQGELPIARQLVQLLHADVTGSDAVWSLLTNSAVLSSNKAILEQLGPQVFNLSESQYLLRQSNPSLLDVVLWSLTVPQFARATGLVAPALQGSQLLNAKWQAAVRRFVVASN